MVMFDFHSSSTHPTHNLFIIPMIRIELHPLAYFHSPHNTSLQPPYPSLHHLPPRRRKHRRRITPRPPPWMHDTRTAPDLYRVVSKESGEDIDVGEGEW